MADVSYNMSFFQPAGQYMKIKIKFCGSINGLYPRVFERVRLFGEIQSFKRARLYTRITYDVNYFELSD